eukprot:6462759-Pyramimonas_sp.AAC.1
MVYSGAGKLAAAPPTASGAAGGPGGAPSTARFATMARFLQSSGQAAAKLCGDFRAAGETETAACKSSPRSAALYRKKSSTLPLGLLVRAQFRRFDDSMAGKRDARPNVESAICREGRCQRDETALKLRDERYKGSTRTLSPW